MCASLIVTYLTTVDVLIRMMQGFSQEMRVLNDQFPQLCILRLWGRYASNSDYDASIRKAAATAAFFQCAKLHSMMFSIRSISNSLDWVFIKGQRSDVEEKRIEVHVAEYDQQLWWEVYGV